MPNEPIKTGERPDGSKFYFWRVDIGTDPVTGKRKQLYRSFDRLKDAKAEYAKVTNAVNNGTHVAPAKLTLNAYIDAFVPGHVRDLEKASARNLQDALKPARERLGEKLLQSIGKPDVEALVEWMATSGRKRGGKPGTGLGPRSIVLTLGALSQVFDMAVSEHKATMNPVRLVKRPKVPKPRHELWSDAEGAQFFAHVAGDRLAAVVGLFALGLRPEEVCGIKWDHVDLEAKVAEVGRNVRTLVAGVGAVEKEAKTQSGVRPLPLDDDLAAALKTWRTVQKAEKLAAGPAYTDGGYVLADEVGAPWEPDKLRRRMHRLMADAGVPKIKPYDAMRHAAASRLARAGVPGHQIAAWLGHANASFTYDTYVHARAEDLAVARDALAAR